MSGSTGPCGWPFCLFLVLLLSGLHSPFHGLYDFGKEILDSIGFCEGERESENTHIHSPPHPPRSCPWVPISRGCNLIDREWGPGTRVVTPLQVTLMCKTTEAIMAVLHCASHWFRHQGLCQSMRGILLPTVTGLEVGI